MINRKFFTLGMAMCLAASALQAEPIDSSRAIAIAREFATGRGGLKSASADDCRIAFSMMPDAGSTLKSATDATLYVVNTPQGFVVVAGDDEVPTPVLGYSDGDAFDLATAAPGALYWLGALSNDICALRNGLTSDAMAPQTANKSAQEAVAPLLGGIMWGQSEPFNNLCPLDGDKRSVVGCVATAMAQIMKMHEWPFNGSGTKRYTASSLGKNLTVNFGTTYYDWAAMLDVYTSGYTDAQAQAAAKLSYHCGVSVEMDYTGDESGASSTNVADALINNFRYDSDVTFYSRCMPTAEWTSLILNELQAGRPVYYSGSGTGGGHAFVCDGYDGDSYFHFNWGWNGVSNGYFLLSALSPLAQGIGGNSDGFNNSQDIVIGIQKPDSQTETRRSLLCLNTTPAVSTSATQRNTEFSVDLTYYNACSISFTGSVAIAIEDAGGNFSVIGTKTGTCQDLGVYSGYALNSVNNKAIVGSDVPDGNYNLCLVYRSTSESDWHKAYCLDFWEVCEVPVTVSGNNVVFGQAQAELTQTKTLTTTRLLSGYASVWTFEVSNPGRPFADTVGIEVLDSDGQTACTFADAFFIAEGETRTIEFSTSALELTPGTYKAYTYYMDSKTDKTYFDSANPATVTVGDEEATPEISVSFSFKEDDTVVIGQEFSFDAYAANAGGYFAGYIYLYLFPEQQNTGTHQTSSAAFVDNGRTETVGMSFIPTCDSGNHQLAAYISDSEEGMKRVSDFIRLRFVTDASGHADVQTQAHEVSIYPNPVAGQAHIATGEAVMERCEVYSASGRRVISRYVGDTSADIDMSGCTPGIHLVRIVFADGSEAAQTIIKK